MNNRRPKILLSGWFGENNVGDELILDSLYKDLLALGYQSVTLYIPNPNSTSLKLYKKKVQALDLHWKSILKSIFRGHFFSSLKAIVQSDIYLIAPGGAIADWDPRSLRQTFSLVIWGKLFRKKVLICGCGAGPFKKPIWKWWSKIVLSFVDKITVRDLISYSELKNIGLKNIELTQDVVLERFFVPKQQKNKSSVQIGLIVSPLFTSNNWRQSNERKQRYIEALRTYIKFIEKQQNFELKIFIMHPELDISFIDEISPQLSPIRFSQEEFSLLDLVVAGRYHAVVLAYLYTIPFIALSYDRKIHDLVVNTEMENYEIHIGDGYVWKDSNLNSEELISKTNVLYENMHEIKGKLQRKLKMQHSRIKNTKMLGL